MHKFLQFAVDHHLKETHVTNPEAEENQVGLMYWKENISMVKNQNPMEQP